MDFRAIEVTPALFDYVVAHGTPPDATYEAIRAETQEKAGAFAGMQIGPDQYALLTLLTQLVGATNAVEIGTFTGTSAVAIARGLAPGGRLTCCDVSDEWTSIARAHWEQAGVADRIDLVLAPATQTLAAMPAEPPIDLAFIDADKPSYIDYYEAIVPRLRPGGLLMVDNVLWSGRVVDEAATDDNTAAIRRFNDHAAADDRCSKVVLTIGDGLTLLRKR
jgi:caffeoyl-CoA O-methyltransferase